MFDMSCIQEIYGKLQDDESKRIYIDRMNYSLTGDAAFLKNMVDHTVRDSAVWKDFVEHLAGLAADHEMVIFGAGIWGKILYHETRTVLAWKAMIDSNPVHKRADERELATVSFDQFMKEYKGEYIVVSSYKNYQGMMEQLHDHDIADDKIIDAGSVIYELTEKAAYFDLEGLLPCREREVFVDAGCFDGTTTRRFFEWCGGTGYSYCLEPDAQNIASIERTLSAYGNYEIIGRAAWSETTTLSMNAKGNFASSVIAVNGQDYLEKVQAVALDDILLKKEVTFIKMDIEGAEAEALRGAEKIITGQKPRLAVSIYHKPEDIWTIPQIILQYSPNYRFYLRHYSFSDYDTVLYAIP